MRTAVLSVPADDVELAADRLWCAGARAVEERSGPGGTCELHTVLGTDDTTATRRLGELPPAWRLRFVDVPDEPADTWRAFARPVVVTDRLVLRPAWLPPNEPADPAEPGPLEIAIEPGGSFGLGDHPTTRLSAGAVLRTMRPGADVLDVGCGSGVLAIVAARLGAGRIVAIDVADAAIEATRANATRNGVAERIEASSAPVSDVTGDFDLVVANILAPALVSMSADLRRLTRPGGVLIVSGVLASRHDHVTAALAPMQVERTAELDGWAAIELRHR